MSTLRCRKTPPGHAIPRRTSPGQTKYTAFRRPWRIIPLVLLGLMPVPAHALQPPAPGSGYHAWLDSWSFNDTNTWTSDLNYRPLSVTNLDACYLGDWLTLVLDSTNAAWLHFNVREADGTTNLTVDQGSILLWFAPSWASTNHGGTGPGVWGRLLEVGSYTTNASYGWWSLYTDPDGANLYFSAQGNDGSQATFLTAPIAWTTNKFHHIALTYSSTNSALYLDSVLVTNGPPVTVLPNAAVLAGGFCIGSDNTGVAQAHGMLDDVTTYNSVLDASTVQSAFQFGSTAFYGNPMNVANFGSAQSYATNTPVFNAIAGPGNLVLVSSNASGCVSSANVWLTNMVATVASNGAVSFQFTIAGGSNSFYDVFASSALGALGSTNLTWAWMGQGYACNTYLLTNLPNSSAYLILGTPQDSDSDGLTDAYELLVSHTDPHKADSSGDGMLDGWKVMWGLNPSLINWAQTSVRSNFGYLPQGWLYQISGARSGTVGLDNEGNLFSVSQ